MRIEVLYFDGCPNHVPTMARVKQVMADLGLQGGIEEIQVTSLEDVQRLKLSGLQWPLRSAP